MPRNSSQRIAPARSAFGGRFGDQHRACVRDREIRRLRDRAPQVILDDEKLGLRVREQLQLLGGSQLVIERHEHAAAEENRVRRNQPLRLIGHDDRGACAALRSRRPASARQRQRSFLELPIREPRVFAVAIRFDQADFIRPAVERARKRCSQRQLNVCEDRASETGLDACGERAEIADALQFVIRQLDVEMIFEAREQDRAPAGCRSPAS